MCLRQDHEDPRNVTRHVGRASGLSWLTLVKEYEKTENTLLFFLCVFFNFRATFQHTPVDVFSKSCSINLEWTHFMES